MQALHCAFANESAEPRMTLQFGFNRRSVVEGKTTMGYGNGQQGLVTYTDDYIDERSRMIPLAVDARRQKYPEETPYLLRRIHFKFTNGLVCVSKTVLCVRFSELTCLPDKRSSVGFDTNRTEQV